MSKSCPQWEGNPLNREHLARMNTNEVRVYAYLAMCAATRRRASLNDIGALHGPGEKRVGAAAARAIVSRFHDQGLVRCGGWGAAADGTPMPVEVAGSPSSRVPEQRSRIHPTARLPGTNVGGGFVAHSSLPMELVAELRTLHRRSQCLNAAPARERGASWLVELQQVTELRAAAFRRWARLGAASAVEREASRLAEAAQALGQQAAAKQAKETKRRSSGDGKER